MKIVSFLPFKDFYSVLTLLLSAVSTVALVGCFVWGRCTYMFSLEVRRSVLKSRGTGVRNITRSFDEIGFAYISTKIGGRGGIAPLYPYSHHSIKRTVLLNDLV